jgi:hypothetical protein
VSWSTRCATPSPRRPRQAGRGPGVLLGRGPGRWQRQHLQRRFHVSNSATLLVRASCTTDSNERLPKMSLGEELAPLRLFTVEEFTDKARQLARLHRANRDQVWRLAEVCEDVHGRSFDAEAILAEVEPA